MQSALQISLFILWVFTVTFAQNEDCTKADAVFPNANNFELNESYKHKETARLSCTTGYVGFVRIECDNGKWKSIGDKECKKKPCGHPGDTENGDFKITSGTEFVFGATVQYTCRTGYLMVSRNSQRHCLENGWNNNIPICEVVKCTPIVNSGGITAIGNIEEPSYGEVVRFECPQKKMLDKRVELVCSHDGSWSESVPTCIDIKCEQPVIENGGVTNPKAEYGENDVLQYQCNRNYNRRPGNPKCTKSGWSMKPECENIVCHIEPSPSGVERTEPIGQTIFSVGESVTIHCLARNWIGRTKKKSKTVLCKETGEWESSIICEQILCGKPLVQNGYLDSWRDSYYPDDTLTYSCYSGFKPEGNHKITCNMQGQWDNFQTCEKDCPLPPYTENAVIILISGNKAEYRCRPNYKLMGKDKISCTNLQWEDPPTCITECHLPPYTENAVITSYTPFESATYKCRHQCNMKGDPTVNCINYKWEEPPKCVSSCSEPPKIEHGIIQSITDSSVTYRCGHGFHMIGAATINCITCGWDEPPKCVYAHKRR